MNNLTKKVKFPFVLPESISKLAYSSNEEDIQIAVELSKKFLNKEEYKKFVDLIFQYTHFGFDFDMDLLNNEYE